MAAAPGGSALRVRRVAKAFAGNQVLRDVHLDVGPGELHALVGANGSGKSTLLRILAGVYRADRGGTIAVHGRQVAAHRTSPRFARAAGLRFVHQGLATFPTLSVAENVAAHVGFVRAWPGRVDRGGLARQVGDLLARVGVAATPATMMGDVAPPDRALLLAAATLADHDRGPRVFVLDEVTAALPASQSRFLYEEMRRRVDDGHTVVLVTHRLDEVATVADRATVLRSGTVSGVLPRAELRPDRLAECIVGDATDEPHRLRTAGPGRVVLEARSLQGGPVHDLHLSLHSGEVVGLTGPVGAGRSEVLQMLFGARAVGRGAILVDGREVRFTSVADAMRVGIAYVPSDRAAAVFPTLSVSDNLTAARGASGRDRFRLRRRTEERAAMGTIRNLAIRASSPRQLMTNLSGGDQQKVVLARWLARSPRVLLLDFPTIGLDIGARRQFERLVIEVVDAGGAVVLASDDFDELHRLADRVLVLRDGRVVEEVSTDTVDAAELATRSLGAPTGSG
jgi:ribose transport system ATP-binding protein